MTSTYRDYTKMETFIYRSRIEAPAEEVFDWHTRPGAFERLTPPWEKVEVIERKGGVRDGARLILKTKIGPLSKRWVVEHRDYKEGKQFRDMQISGPFVHWDHTHLVESVGPSASFLEDRIQYTLPLGAVGKIFGKSLVQSKLKDVFRYRHRIIREDIENHKNYGGSPMKILVSGSTGLIGSALVPFLSTSGHSVTRLTRSKSGRASKFGEGEAYWNIKTKDIDRSAIEGHDAVVHLAGESVAGIWTEEKKIKIRKSRVDGTRLLSEALAELKNPPKVLVCASAVGYYGNRGDQILTEESEAGKGFLAEVCREWEAATKPAADKGIRVLNVRFGLVLSPEGGALKAMLTPFRLGVGGPIGSGRQYISWIAIDDAVGAIYHAMMSESLAGPVNMVSPNPVTNSEFTKTLGQVLNRPTLLWVPEFALRLLAGEMAEEMFLASTRVLPNKLSGTRYKFRQPKLNEALKHLLGKGG